MKPAPPRTHPFVHRTGLLDVYRRYDDKTVGKGTYGTVYRYYKINDPSKSICSVKESKIDDDKNITPSIFRELVLLSEINFPHIVHIKPCDIFSDLRPNGSHGGTISFVYDYGAIDVRKMIQYYKKKNQPIDPVIIKSILFQLLLALEHLHKRKIAHCDITPSNLLLMFPEGPQPGIIKLIDFGLSRTIENTGEKKVYGVVTVWYRAPELLLGDTDYDTKIDIWAAGCIFAELLRRDALFAPPKSENDPTKFNQTQFQEIINVLGEIRPTDTKITYQFNDKIRNIRNMKKDNRFDQITSNPLEMDLLTKMLTYNPRMRISATEALNHPYFNELPACVMNISGQFPVEDWEVLKQIGTSSNEPI